MLRGVYDDLARPPLSATALTRALAGGGWRVEVLESVDSTNRVVAARADEPPGLVVVAEQQTAGRGRLDRSWVSPPRAGLTFSLLVRPDLPPARWGLVPLLAGAAVVTAVRSQTGLDAALKWPNDVLVGGRKLCGLLAEVAGPAVVVGIGFNVTTLAAELPHPQATSLAVEGVVADRDTVLRAVLRALEAIGLGPSGGSLEPGLQAYRALCSSVGRRVRVELPGGAVHEGTAQAVDDEGRLVVDGVPHAAGDVVHLR